jgi:hypothetical protein
VVVLALEGDLLPRVVPSAGLVNQLAGALVNGEGPRVPPAAREGDGNGFVHAAQVAANLDAPYAAGPLPSGGGN